MFAQALQVVKFIRAPVMLRYDVVNIHVLLAKFPSAPSARVPTMVGLGFFEICLTVIAQLDPPLLLMLDRSALPTA